MHKNSIFCFFAVQDYSEDGKSGRNMLQTTLNKYMICIFIFAAVVVCVVVCIVVRLHAVNPTHFETSDPYF
jgi:Na+/H+-dicarboxylate symporter